MENSIGAEPVSIQSHHKQELVCFLQRLCESQATSEPNYELWYERPKLEFLLGVSSSHGL